MRHPKNVSRSSKLQHFCLFKWTMPEKIWQSGFLLDKLLTSTIAKCGISLRHLQKKKYTVRQESDSALFDTTRSPLCENVWKQCAAYGTGCLSRSQRFESYSAIIEILRSRSSSFFLAGAGAAQTVRLQLHLLVNFQNWSTIEIRLTVLPKFFFLTTVVYFLTCL